MGYGYYDTPHGPAGYSVDDVCHAEGCTVKIDRGLSYLCGSDPLTATPEHGCSWWFCGKHLFYAADIHEPSLQLCTTCIAALDEDDEGTPTDTEETDRAH